MTSNIAADFPPIYTAAGLDGLFGRLQSRGPIKELGVVCERRQTVGRQMVNDLLDFPSQFGRRHWGSSSI
jgi:hypothetical protein